MVAEATPTNSISISYASSGHERATQREGFHIKCTTRHFRKKKKKSQLSTAGHGDMCSIKAISILTFFSGRKFPYKLSHYSQCFIAFS